MWRRFFSLFICTLIVGLILSFSLDRPSIKENDFNQVTVTDADREHNTLQLEEPHNHGHSSRASIDSDDDGLSDEDEMYFDTDESDPDSDDDGVLDGDEELDTSKNKKHQDNDPDGDGLNNALDEDSDNDGILDGTEKGLTEDDINYTATNTSNGHFFADRDPTTTTDMTSWDTDGDTYSDGAEDWNLNGKFEPGRDETDPNFKDIDKDGLNDDTEDLDDDNDGMPDKFEKLYSNALNPLNSSDGDEDYDNDGFTNYLEYLGHDTDPENDDWTNPEDPTSYPLIDSDKDDINDDEDSFPHDPAASADTDGDSCPDSWNPGMSKNESTTNLHLDSYPMDPSACLDTDGDNLPDELKGDSVLTEDPDDDNDAMPDSWELSYSLNPKNASDAILDFDQDGFNNLNEYIHDTNPQDPDNYPDISRKSPDDEEDWIPFILFLIFIIFITMIIAIVIGTYIIKTRSSDEEFWLQTFGDHRRMEDEPEERYRRRYMKWQRGIESETRRAEMRRPKYKLEIIGGPKDDHENGYTPLSDYPRPRARRSEYKHDPRYKGKQCLWCDRGITSKYIKQCPELRTPSKRCRDGPFCSEICLQEHLITVPHYHGDFF